MLSTDSGQSCSQSQVGSSGPESLADDSVIMIKVIVKLHMSQPERLKLRSSLISVVQTLNKKLPVVLQ